MRGVCSSTLETKQPQNNINSPWVFVNSKYKNKSQKNIYKFQTKTLKYANKIKNLPQYLFKRMSLSWYK